MIKVIQNRLTYHPDKINSKKELIKSGTILAKLRSKSKKKYGDKHIIDEITIKTTDNKNLNAIYLKNNTTPLHILFAHGNAGNIYNRTNTLLQFSKFGSVLMFDYRGFGKSIGSPTELGLYLDISSVWNYLVKNGVKPNDIVLYGESLGSSVSAWLAMTLCKQRVYPRALVLQSGFSSIKSLVEQFKPKFLKYIVQNEYPTDTYIKKICFEIPIMIVHSREDTFIDISHKNKLMDATSNICSYYEIRGDHNTPELDADFFRQMNDYFMNLRRPNESM